MHTTARPTAVITFIGKRFQYAKVLCLMRKPLCSRIPFHSKPARLAEKVKLTAPMLLATANAIAAARKVLYGRLAARQTFVMRIVAPILVPEILQRMTPKTPTSHMVGYI